MMAMGDLPLMGSSAYTSTTTPLHMMGLVGMGDTSAVNPFVPDDNFRRILGQLPQQKHQVKQESNVAEPSRRMVKVVIVDTNENIPLDQCVLYSGEEKVTDATDQELFFEIDIKELLAKHNEKRVKVVDKKVKERTEYLEPAKIRDLKMVVVNIAQF